MAGYGNGEYVKFIVLKVGWILAVYQWFYLGWARVALGGEVILYEYNDRIFISVL
jgi:hypothetical protein